MAALYAFPWRYEPSSFFVMVCSWCHSDLRDSFFYLAKCLNTAGVVLYMSVSLQIERLLFLLTNLQLHMPVDLRIERQTWSRLPLYSAFKLYEYVDMSISVFWTAIWINGTWVHDKGLTCVRIHFKLMRAFIIASWYGFGTVLSIEQYSADPTCGYPRCLLAVLFLTPFCL